MYMLEVERDVLAGSMASDNTIIMSCSRMTYVCSVETNYPNLEHHGDRRIVVESLAMVLVEADRWSVL